jgi:hypothetical protein
MWVLEVSVQLDDDNFGSQAFWEEVNTKLTGAMDGGVMIDAGTGMGARDMVVQYATQALAEAARERVVALGLTLLYAGVSEQREG